MAETFYNNVMMATQLIEAGSRHGVEKMIYLGSASSYPANAPVPLREQDLFKGLPDAGRANTASPSAFRFKRSLIGSNMDFTAFAWFPLIFTAPATISIPGPVL